MGSALQRLLAFREKLRCSYFLLSVSASPTSFDFCHETLQDLEARQRAKHIFLALPIAVLLAQACTNRVLQKLAYDGSADGEERDTVGT